MGSEMCIRDRSGQLLQQSVLSKRIRIKEFLSALDVAASLMDARNYISKLLLNDW